MIWRHHIFKYCPESESGWQSVLSCRKGLLKINLRKLQTVLIYQKKNGTNWLDDYWNICSNVTSEKCLIKYPEENGPIILWGSCWKFLCGEHRRMVVPQLVHSIKRTFWWRTMTAIQKMLLSMITNITIFWMRKADQKIKPYLNRNLRPIILLISPLKKIPPLFIVSKIFQLSINN